MVQHATARPQRRPYRRYVPSTGKWCMHGEVELIKWRYGDCSLALVSEGDDCIITATPSTRRRFDLPPLSLVSDQDLMDAELTNPDRALVPDL